MARAQNDWKARNDLYRAFLGILSRPGEPDVKAGELVDTVVRQQWKPAVPAGLERSKCRYHPGTDLEQGRCPIPRCGWSPYD